MKINTINRKYFSLGGLFEYSTSNDDYLSSYNNGDVEYVSSSAENNGVSSMIDAVPSQEGNTLTIARNGSVGSTFYHKNSYCASSDDIRILTPKFNMNSYTGLFLSTIINKESFRFSYGRKLTKDKVLNMKIKLPADNFGDPDRQFMENYIKLLHYKPITTKNKLQKFGLNISEWKEFKVGNLFPKVKVEKFSSIPDSDGNKEFISSTTLNNGVSKYVDENIIKGNCITVSTNGNCFDCFYHENGIVVSNDVEVLYSKNLNKYSGMFICSVLQTEKYRWSYGRKPKNNKVFDTIIKLPVDKNGEPDREFMENYIKSLPYGDRI